MNTSSSGGGKEQTQLLIEKADQLLNTMHTLAQQSGIDIDKLRKQQLIQSRRQEQQETRQKRQRKITFALIATFAIDLAVTVAVIFMGHSVRQQSHEIEVIQQEVKGEVLCPLYQQFINADTPRAREAARAAGQDMAVRAHAFEVIREGYKTLDCKPPTNNKSTPTPPSAPRG